MADERVRDYLSSQNVHQAFTTNVQPNSSGGWFVTVDLGEGASVTKWCPDEREAARYGDELRDWLARGRPSKGE